MAAKKLIAPWATEVNYPAGSDLWSGNPTKVSPAGDIFTPNTKAPAPYFNFILNQTKQDIQDLSDFTACDVAQNWLTTGTMASASTSGYRPFCGAYDPVNDQWLFGMYFGSAIFLQGTDGFGTNPVQIGGLSYSSTSEVPQHVLKDPSDAVTYYISTSRGSGGVSLGTLSTVFKLDTSAPAYTSVLSDGSGTPGDLALGYFNGYLTAFAGGSAGHIPVVSYSSNKGATWASSYTAPVTVATWTVKSGPNEIIGLPVQAVGSNPFLARSTDGHSFTTIALTGLGSTDIPTDLVNLGGSTWLMAVFTISSGTKFQKSTDGGLTWSALSTITALNAIPTTLAAQGTMCAFGQLVALLVKVSSTVQKVIFSSDGGATWRFAIQSTNPGSGVNPGLYQSACQLVAINAAQVQFSRLSGVPSVAVT